MTTAFNRLFIVGILVLGLLLPAISILGPKASAETWTDDFTGNDLDPRWTRGGLSGTAIVDGTTYLTPASFTGDSNITWYGPHIRTAISTAGIFNITAVFKCIAETTEFNLARAEVRLFDTTGGQVYAFGWTDSSMSDNKVSIYLNGASDADVLYSTAEDFTYSIFVDKSLGLARTASETIIYIEGNLIQSFTPSPKPIGYIELGFMRYKEYPTYCTPEVININSINIDTTAPTAPDAPSNLVCEGGEGQVNLTWSAPTNGGLQITSYKIFRGTTSGNLQHLTTVGYELSYADNSVMNGQRYYYAVSAANEIGESELSQEASAVPMTTPDSPGNLQALAGNSYVNLSWAAPATDGGSGITNYLVYRREESSSLSLLDTVGDVRTYNDTGLINDQTYYYALSAVNSVGEGTMTNEISATPGSSTSAPSEPRELTASAGDGQVTLIWSTPLTNGNSRITNYHIYKGLNINALILLSTIDDTQTYTDTGLTNGVTVYYKVSAENAIGIGPLSAVVNATPFKYSPPSAPLSPRATPFDGKLLLQWEVPLSDGGTSITGYIIYRGASSENLSEVASIGVVLNYMDTGLDNGREYHYRIAAFNGEGEGPMSEPFHAMPIGAGGGNSGDGNTTDPGSDWSLTSAFVTVVILAVMGAVALFYLRRSGSSK
ncbi:MAG: hypothetical protein AYK23_03010 [Candidatus Proteinoplasmatales archaeon SG8-5]|nr:MAG: hypothetical protein AYK23_03010 [Candidatus Proteinoplasmatales archaeon SG8-5]